MTLHTPDAGATAPTDEDMASIDRVIAVIENEVDPQTISDVPLTIGDVWRRWGAELRLLSEACKLVQQPGEVAVNDQRDSAMALTPGQFPERAHFIPIPVEAREQLRSTLAADFRGVESEYLTMVGEDRQATEDAACMIRALLGHLDGAGALVVDDDSREYVRDCLLEDCLSQEYGHRGVWGAALDALDGGAR